jgi:uncharacterized protein
MCSRHDTVSGRMMGGLTTLRDGVQALGEATRDAARLTTLRLAVTGLSRAGKTVFLVSLIGNLLAMGRGMDALPALGRRLAATGGGSRLVSVSIEPSGVQPIPRFAFEAHRDALARGDAPAWPPFTDRPAFIALRLVLAPSGMMDKALGLALGPRVIRLELLDYPGEWLLDLPLLEQGFHAWSVETLSLLAQPGRAPMAREFLAFIAALNPSAAADEAVASHGFRLYRDTLRRLREEAGLRWLQPGRALMPGPWGEVPLQEFFPWAGAPEPGRGSLGALLRDRFEAYKREVRDSFFRPWFSEFDRQVVLVDVLGALWAGKPAFEDTARALTRIGASYGRLLEGGLLQRRRLRRVAFAATKSDHVDDLQRPHLRQALEHMVGTPPGGRALSFHQICALRCTTDADAPGADGRVHRVVMGVPLGGKRQQAFRPGPVPAGAVPENFWANSYFALPQFRPPEFPGGEGAPPLAHINMDGLLVALLEDAL